MMVIINPEKVHKSVQNKDTKIMLKDLAVGAVLFLELSLPFGME